MRSVFGSELTLRTNLLAEQKLLKNGLFATTRRVIGAVARQGHEALQASPQREGYPDARYDLRKRRNTTLTTSYAPPFPDEQIPVPGNEAYELNDISAATAQRVLTYGGRISTSRKFRTINASIMPVRAEVIQLPLDLTAGQNGFIYGTFSRCGIPHREIANPRSSVYRPSDSLYFKSPQDLRHC